MVNSREENMHHTRQLTCLSWGGKNQKACFNYVIHKIYLGMNKVMKKDQLFSII